MAFASIYVPDFMVQAVLRGERSLCGRPVALIDGTPPIENVVAANQAASSAGIKLGMAKSQAAQFCGVGSGVGSGIEIRSRSRTQEKAAHAALLDLGWSVSPRIEDNAPDTIILDISGLASLFGDGHSIANKLVERAASLGLLLHVAIASRIEAAIHAARGFPGIIVIPPGEEAKFLSSLPVAVLLPSIEARETLQRWGIRTCQALGALPVLQLSERLGQEGVRLHELARGASVRSLVLAEPGTVFEEEMELEYAVAELEPLAFLLGRLLDQLCSRLDARSLAASAIRVQFDLRDFVDDDRQVFPATVPATSSQGSPPAWPAALGLSAALNDQPLQKQAPATYQNVLSLPVPMRDSKMLLKLLRLRLQSNPPLASIVKITLAADSAPPRAAQGGLFLPSSPDPEKLELTVARLANLVGAFNIGSPELVDTYRPGEFRMIRFVPPADESKIARRTKAAAEPVEQQSESPGHRPACAFRIFRPALPARVELHHGCPARVFIRGRRGNVMAISGPWRSSGDWWREDAWRQEEWDLEIHFDVSSSGTQRDSNSGMSDGLYRVYYDLTRQSWFVRGIYD